MHKAKLLGTPLTKKEQKNIFGGIVYPTSHTCEADCPNGRTVTCYGYNGVGCSTSDGRGCQGNDANGTTYWNAC